MFSCDEPIEFEVTLTNDSPLPMLLQNLPKGVWRCHFRLMVYDADGFCLFPRALWASDSYSGRSPETEESREPCLLRPGRSVSGRVRFDPPLAAYDQDPSSAREYRLWYTPVGKSTQRTWYGNVAEDDSIALRCSYAAWAAELSRPSNGRRALLRIAGAASRWQWERADTIVAPSQGVWVRIALHGPIGRPTASGDSYSGWWQGDMPGQPGEMEAVASCFSVERDGTPVRITRNESPADEKAEERRLSSTFVRKLDLAQFFSFDKPGTYRLRFVHPHGDPPCMSNVTSFTVPERRTKEGK